MWEKNPTVTFRRILTDPYNKLGCLLSISQLIKKASCFLNITPAVVHLWESFNPSVNTTHIHQKFPFFSSSFKHQGPSPLPRLLAAIQGIFHFLSFPDPSGPHFLILFRPSALKEGKTSVEKTISIPSHR